MKIHNTIALIALTASARAGTPAPEVFTPPPAVADAWEFRAGLPAWISGLKGDAGVLGTVEPVDVAFKDIVPVIDMAAALSFEARRGRWGILTSGLYMDISNAAGTPGPLVDEVALELKQLMLDAALSYAVVDNDCGSLELLAGARYNYIKLNLTIDGPLGTVSREGSKSWVDPYVGVLGRSRISDSISLVGKGDIGGFGVGSDLTWQLYGGLEFQISRSCYVGVGYRYLSVDYTSGGFTYDLATSGPQIELGFEF